MSAAAAAAAGSAPATTGAIYYVPPPPHPLPVDYDAFYASLSANEKELMEIAKTKLGSSFFVQWCHAYRNWKKKQASATAASSKR